MDVVREICQLDEWINENDYDSINSLPKNRVVDFLVARYGSLGVIWRQLFRLSPINIRRVFGQNADKGNPKASILLSLAYLELWNHYRYDEFLKNFKSNVDCVISRRADSVKNFAVPQLRRIFVKSYKASEGDVAPFLTFWAGVLFLKAYEYLGEHRFLELAVSVGNYFVRELPRTETDEFIYFYYVPNHSAGIRCYNCSALISAYLLMLSEVTKNPVHLELGRKGIQYILSVQNENGSWFYTNGPAKYIDNYHSAFILFSLYEAKKYYFTNDLQESFQAGLDYYRKHLFKEVSTGLIRPVHFVYAHLPLNSNLIQKVDLRDCAISIILFSLLSEEDPIYAKYSHDILNWTLRYMKGGNGYFCELTWLWKNKIPYREFQAWMLLALSIFSKTSGK